jgi:hypothetical protein
MKKESGGKKVILEEVQQELDVERERRIAAENETVRLNNIITRLLATGSWTIDKTFHDRIREVNLHLEGATARERLHSSLE